MKELEEKFNNMHLLDREERVKLIRQLTALKPDFLKPYYPRWWWWRRCTVKVLVVTDGGLDFGTGGFGLSEFLMAFNQLQSNTWNNYQITLGHRGPNAFSNPNPLVVAELHNFKFDTSVTLNDFDQIWLFGISNGASIPANELNPIENYMNGGGGLFATGDHGSLGSEMCGSIERVKDMRYWAHPPDTASHFDSMRGTRRNDTNRPRTGDTTSLYFDNQSDNVPQNIAVRTFGGGMPHPLLAISTTIRPSGVIDVMPDHPHEGECKPETSFTVGSVTVPTQIIATSFVLGGSTTNRGLPGSKSLTDPHCFPSIAVWDGRLANIGRIVVDSTWHHFVNINLNGEGSQVGDLAGRESGLTAADYRAIQQYFMNISLWISRRKSWWCWRRILWVDLLKDSQLIEASLNDPKQKIEDISLADLASIGSLAEEILSSKINPSFAREFLNEAFEATNPNLAAMLDIWRPKIEAKGKASKSKYYHPWLNLDLMLYTAIGAGFIAMRDDKTISSDDFDEKDLECVLDVFNKGMEFGLKKSIESLRSDLKGFAADAKIKL
jgi:hypothetical protein